MDSVNGVSVRLAATAQSVRAARHAVDDLGWLNERAEAAFNARLLITELVTNSVRHAGLTRTDTVTLDIEPLPGAVRVEVADTGNGFPRPTFSGEPPEGPSGRGIYLVDALADRWGIEHRHDPDAPRTIVWFELDL